MKPQKIMSIRRAYAIMGREFPSGERVGDTSEQSGDFREVEPSDFMRAIRDGIEPEECAPVDSYNDLGEDSPFAA